MTPLALILARAASKGVPGKNRAIIAGKPCVLWSIDAARQSRRGLRIAISTDDRVIQELAISTGADLVVRPPGLASDSARIDDAARHAVTALGDSDLDPIVLLYANVPVRPDGLIDRALDRFERTHADSVQSYAPVGKHHPWWTARVDASTGAVSPWEGDTLNHGVYRRQDLPPAYIPDGGVLVMSRRALFLRIPGVPASPHACFGLRCFGILNCEGDVVDIDSPLDLLVADTMLRGERRPGAEQGGVRDAPASRIKPVSHPSRSIP